MAAIVTTQRGSSPFSLSGQAKIGLVVILVYALLASTQLNVNWGRVYSGMGIAGKFLASLFPPSIERPALLWQGIVESLQITVLASLFGILCAIPLSLLGARNLMPLWATWPSRIIVSMCRSLHPVILAILLVKAVGFGALAGILALTVSSTGFVSKLLTESIEEISMKQVEAIRSTGAPYISLMLYGVLPQIFGRFVGFATYQCDSNLRNSSMVGIVGAGGIGGVLFSAFQRFDYSYLCGILLCIIGLVLIGEMLAQGIRKIMCENEPSRTTREE